MGDALTATVIAGADSPYGGLGELDCARVQGTLAEESGGTVVSGTVRLRFPTIRHKVVAAAIVGVLAAVGTCFVLIDPDSILPLGLLVVLAATAVWQFRHVRFGSEAAASAVAVHWIERVIEGKADWIPEAQ